MTISTVVLFPNALKADSRNIASDVQRYLTARGCKVYAEDSEANAIGALPLSLVDLTTIDMRISLGGDGTLLRAVHNHPLITAPLIAINVGSLGFMADIPINEIYSSLDRLLAEEFTIQHRMMIEGICKHHEPCSVVNDIVIHRGQNPSLVELSIFVDGRYLNTFSGDGMIIATPSGSTAYSLSAGGPILAPDLEAMVLTPICPHTISNRPIVLMPKNSLEIEFTSSSGTVEVVCDGFSMAKIESGQGYTIKASTQDFKLVNLPHHDYFNTLREKLGWGWAIKNHHP